MAYLVTGGCGFVGSNLAAEFVLHVVVADERGPADRDRMRRALASAWQRAGDWGLRRLAAPLVGRSGGTLTTEDAAALLLETLPAEADGDAPELAIVVETEAERDAVEALVRRKT